MHLKLFQQQISETGDHAQTPPIPLRLSIQRGYHGNKSQGSPGNQCNQPRHRGGASPGVRTLTRYDQVRGHAHNL